MSIPSIRVIAGLGNPGSEYAPTRHNAGFRVVDAYAAEEGLSWKRERKFDAEISRLERGGMSVLLVKPQTYMNESGRSLGAVARFFRIPVAAFTVVYDEVQVDLGKLKLSLSGSAGGHNGIASLLSHLGNGFVRFRVGVGPKDPPQMDIKDFVLGRFSGDQEKCFVEAIPQLVKSLRLLIDKGPEQAMNVLNRRVRPPAPKKVAEVPKDSAAAPIDDDSPSSSSDSIPSNDSPTPG